MDARDGSGFKVARRVTSCSECLAWGLMYAQGVCLACYNFAARAGLPDEAGCTGCRRRARVKKGYCRLCWCQAREDREITATDARSRVVLGPHLARVRHHQLFLADLFRLQALPRAVPRRRGVKGRPLKAGPPPAGRPPRIGAQLTLISDLPRTFRFGAVDLRADELPDNPWLAWARHLAYATAEAHGFGAAARGALNRNLVMLLATHADGDQVRVSQFHHLIRRDSGTRSYGAMVHVLDVLTEMRILADDRQPVFERWLEHKLADLGTGIAAPVARWARTLRYGGPRRRARHRGTAMRYVRVLLPVLATWSNDDRLLREIRREDITGFLEPLRGEPRRTALTGLRSLFRWAKAEGVVFTDPTAGVRHAPYVRPIWQRLADDEIADAVVSADTARARVVVVLAAVHALRPGQIRSLQLDDVDLPGRRLRIAGQDRPLDELTCRVLTEWATYRRDRWPRTANPHLLITRESALTLAPMGHHSMTIRPGLLGTVDRLRIDRQLDEAIETGADPLHLAAVFGISDRSAITYAANARALLDRDEHDEPGR